MSIKKILREEISSVSGIALNLIRDGTSEYGADLHKGTSVFNTITPSDTCIIFELVTQNADSDVSFSADNKLYYYKNYSLYVKSYGDNSLETALTTIASLRSEKSRLNLKAKCVYLCSITEPETIYEFINNRCWLRTDYEIILTVENKITHTDIEDYLTFSLNVIKK